MMPVVNHLMLALGNSLAASIVAKATVVMTLALVSVRLARTARAAVRHALLAATFAVLLVLPVAAILVPAVRIQVPTASVGVAPLSFDTALGAASSGAPLGGSTGAERQTPHPISLSVILLTLWMAGAGVFLLPMVTGLWRIRSLRRSASPWREEAALNSGMRRRVEVLINENVTGPMTCGVVHPAIVLPSDAPVWCREDLDRAIVHELEHVRRGDWMWHCLSRTVCAAYWFHPMVWVAWRRLGLEAERACDDAVLARSEATAYADQLVGLAQRLSKSPALAMASRTDLSTRVRAVLDSRQRRGRAGTILVALACAAAVVVIAGISPLRTVAAAPSPTLEFEVASIKPIDPAAMHYTTPRVSPGGRVVLEATTLKGLVLMAFDLSYWQVSGGDAWMEKERYDIEAKAPANLQPPITNLRHSNFGIEDERLREMMQSLLIERFHLKFHRETKNGKVYLLEKKGNTVVLRPTEGPSSSFVANGPDKDFSGDIGFAGGRWVIFDLSMPQLAKFAASYVLHATVLDRTGLIGSFDYKQPTRLPDSEVDYSDPPFLPLMQELGLKFESVQGPVETFVIDRADKPSPN